MASLAVLAGGCSGSPTSRSSGPPPTSGQTRRVSAAVTTPTTQSATSLPTSTAGTTSGGGFEAAGLSFVDRTHGWAVGTAPCTDAAGRCTQLLVAADRRHWYVEPVHGDSPFGVAVSRCGQSCVTGVAFMTRRIGYAYSRSALWLSTDGGAHWRRETGSAFAMLAAPDTVVRVSASDAADCLPGCRYRLQWAAASAPGVWHTSRLPAVPEQFGISLVGAGAHVYFLSYGHIAGGEPSARAELFVSGDGGRTWTIRRYRPPASPGNPSAGVGEPCPQQPGAGGEVDSEAIAVTAAGTVMIRCVLRGNPASAARQFVITSTDHAATFVRRAAPAPNWEFAGGGVATGPRYLPSGFGWRLRGERGYAVTIDGGRTWDNRAFALVAPPAPLPDCTASQLRVRGGRQGAPFRAAAGDIELVDVGSACRLHGLPKVVILDRSGTALPVHRIAAPAAVTRTVELRSGGGTVRLPLTWTNWCGPAPGPLTIAVTLPGSGGRLTAPFDGPPDYDYVPGCIAPARASTLQLLGYTRVG